MSTAARERPRTPRGLRAVAALTLASLSCTTVRVPASGIAPSVAIRGDAAEPQVELWIESGAQVSPAEAARAAADARAALAQALASRRLEAGEQLLVVRAQGVSRTASRRADQTAAVAGIVVAAVAVVAVIVVAVVASRGKGGVPGIRAASPPAIRPAAPPVPVAVRPPPVPVRPPSVPAALPRAPVVASPVRPASSPGHAHVGVTFGANVQVGAPAPLEGAPPAPWSDAVATSAVPEAAPVDVPTAHVTLPPPPPLEVARRGFFARDSTRLELTLVDRATGRPLWVKTVERGIDLRDPGAVRALLDSALDAPDGWEPAQPAT
ncbi:MAG TPA: hypothetical protein VFL83_08785 [Anaeromyxobacter sp.]|nr:hypothetical protein [Anaeromyxobacter sp.]